MKTILLTGYDPVMAPIGELTSPLMEDYAGRFGIDYSCWLNYTDKHPAYWEKVPFICDRFDEGYERIIWLDADQMITNPYVTPWKDMKSGFHASMDWGQDATDASHFSMCGFVVCRDASCLFEWLEENKSDWVDKPFPEQAPMRWLYSNRPIANGKMTTHPRRAFNAVPIQVHDTAVDPWQTGDWCAHITMVPVERRVEIFHELKKLIE